MGMKKYAVTVIEKLSRSIEIEADSETDAILKSQAMWINGEIILGDRDFEGTEYKVDSITPEYPCVKCCSPSERINGKVITRQNGITRYKADLK